MNINEWMNELAYLKSMLKVNNQNINSKISTIESGVLKLEKLKLLKYKKNVSFIATWGRKSEVNISKDILAYNWEIESINEFIDYEKVEQLKKAGDVLFKQYISHGKRTNRFSTLVSNINKRQKDIQDIKKENIVFMKKISICQKAIAENWANDLLPQLAQLAKEC